VCPASYLCGAIAVYAFRTLYFPAGVSRVICFMANKGFTLHVLDRVMDVFGERSWNLFRPQERCSPPTLGLINLLISTGQLLFFGIFLEIYRDRLFTSGFELAAWAFKWIVAPFRLVWSIVRPVMVVAVQKEVNAKRKELK
jgi:hypothetical protein